MNINGFLEAKIIKTLFFSMSFVLINTKAAVSKISTQPLFHFIYLTK